MPIDYKNIKKQFEKSFKDYDKNAVVQNFTAQKLVMELSKFRKDFDNVLELGVGTGLATKRIVAEINYKNYYANDVVEKSKLYVQKVLPEVNFLHGNALKIKPNRKMDLIISNAMFQWFENLEKAVEILKFSLEKDGILAFSTFAPDNFTELKDITGLSLQYKSKDEIEMILEKLGFKILYCENFHKELTFNTPLELLAHMKKTGVNSLSEKIWTIKKVKEFCDNYSKRYPKTKLTYSPIIVIAKR